MGEAVLPPGTVPVDTVARPFPLRVLVVGPLPPPAGGMVTQTAPLVRLLRSDGANVDLGRFASDFDRVPGDAPHIVATRNLEKIYDIPTALLVAARDDVAMADAALRVLRDSELWMRLREAGTGEVQQHAWPRVRRQWLELYAQVHSGGRLMERVRS